MKRIPKFSSVDADLRNLKWQVDCKGYAYWAVRSGRKIRHVFAHRMVVARMTGRELTRKEIVDHINFNTLDNRRNNLRITDCAGSAQHRRFGPFRGTVLHRNGKWQAQVGQFGKMHYLGLFTDRCEAASVAAKKRKELNFLSFT